MYVDDGLIVGPVDLCRALAEVLLKTWQMKIQWFLPSAELKVGQKVQIGDKQVPVRQELQFLGMVIRRTEEGVALHQQPWVETELERRGWTAVKGAANLPEWWKDRRYRSPGMMRTVRSYTVHSRRSAHFSGWGFGPDQTCLLQSGPYLA